MSACPSWLPSSSCRRVGFSFLNHPAPHLVELDALEQCLEIALAEALVALALDDFEEDRADHILREDLQQQPLPLRRRAVHQDAALLEFRNALLVAFDALREKLVIRVGRVLERNSAAADDVHALVDVRGAERDVLDALALIFAEELLDLALVVLALVERDADLAARAGHGLREEAGDLPFDVEVANLAEVEELFVELGPDAHPAAVHVVREVVD